jgi:hypothetical protein
MLEWEVVLWKVLYLSLLRCWLLNRSIALWLYARLLECRLLWLLIAALSSRVV